MKLRAEYCKLTLNFRFDAGTSRGVLKNKDSFFIKIYDELRPEVYGLGEAGPLLGLSLDYETAFIQIQKICQVINNEDIDEFKFEELIKNTHAYPSVVFALETALLDLQNQGQRIIYKNDFSLNQSPISINGLVWMGEKQFMLDQIKTKINEGFKVIKIKVAAISLEEELSLLSYIRKEFKDNDLTIRLDANGGLQPNTALETLKQFSEFDIHSIEQPIKVNLWDKMAEICKQSPIPIALDEELIGNYAYDALLQQIKPQYIILKPSLLGGFAVCDKWIKSAEKHQIAWWMTSALETNIGLNAISQFCGNIKNNMPHGLGTGKLYHNNVDSPLEVSQGTIKYNQNSNWNLEYLQF